MSIQAGGFGGDYKIKRGVYMFIQPSTEIKILRNVPIEDTYEHTLWFNTVTQQANYFSGLAKYSINDSVYQRVDSKNIKVAISAENLYDCNYIMFKNTGFGNKWFYAFLTNIQYVNNDTSIITYEIDVMQTWHFDYQMKQCYVLREHPVTDVIGEHTVPENVETGDYITLHDYKLLSEIIPYPYPHDIRVGLLTTGTNDAVNSYVAGHSSELLISNGSIINGTPNNATLILTKTDVGSSTTGENIFYLSRIYNLSTDGNKIISIFTFPATLVNYPTEHGTSSMKHTYFSKTKTELPMQNCLSQRNDGRTIQNNKLFTYPYCSLLLHTVGNTKELKYEMFTGNNRFNFDIYGTLEPNPKFVCVPQNYNGYSSDFQSTVSYGNYPQLPWINDGYQIWLAQNQASHNQYIEAQQYMLGANLLTIAAVAGLATATGGVGGLAFGAMGALSGAKGALTNFYNIEEAIAKRTDAKATPDSLQGEISGGNPLTYSNNNDIHAICRSIKPEFVTIIDDYFSKFGYQTNLNKIPNRNSRRHWNYVKTSACVITGSVPNVYTQQICSIYNNGITFWKNPSEVGNYSLDNRA